MSNPSTSPWTAWPDGSERWDNRMAAQHLPRDLVRQSSGLNNSLKRRRRSLGKIFLRPWAKIKFDAPMFEPEVIRKPMYCIEESTCDIVGSFRRPSHLFGAPVVIRRPGKCAPLGLRYAPAPTWENSNDFQTNKFIANELYLYKTHLRTD